MAIIECVCPPKPDGSARHPDGDVIKLREKLPFRAALHARNTVVLLRQEDVTDPAEILAALTEVYLYEGIASWTVYGEVPKENGHGVDIKPLEPNRHTIRAFIEANPDAAMAIGDEADELYSEAVITPLVARASASSPPTPITKSTSATNGASPRPRKRSKPSLITTTRTDDTVKMTASPGGGYS